MDEYDEYIAENRAHWEELAAVHPSTEFYDVASFLEGETTLDALEREEVGADVAGASLLHLQCHFGLDTLSWVREGAREAVGVDFSETAVDTARDLRDAVGIDAGRARFVRSDLYDLSLAERFEVAFTSYGTIYWLPDLDRWAEVIAAHLAPGGTFYVADLHPFVNPFGEDTTADDPTFAYPYFPDERLTFEEQGSYADGDLDLDNPRSHGWHHPIGGIVTALVGAGLSIEFLHEHPWATFARFDAMEADEEGRWRLPDLDHELPMTFSLKATLAE
jgi:SAM-dependent methyltransferase